jgi:LAO/AO transport system kinase
LGDGIQAMKAGILELADIYVVHKSDQTGAATLAKELRSTLALGQGPAVSPVIRLVSSTTGEGVVELADALERLLDTLRADGRLASRRQTIAGHEIMRYVENELRERLLGHAATDAERLAADVAARRLAPGAAAAMLLQGLAYPDTRPA